jgi:hypothetical protein
MKIFLLQMLISMVLFSSVLRGQEKKEEKHAHDEMLKIGDVGFLKMEHDEAKGTVTVELFQTDKKAALVIEGDLKLNAIIGKEKKEFVLKVKEGTTKYEVTDDLLKKEFEGRFVLKVKDKQYNVAVGGHDDHKGHKH